MIVNASTHKNENDMIQIEIGFRIKSKRDNRMMVSLVDSCECIVCLISTQS